MGIFGTGPIENDWSLDAIDELDSAIEEGTPPLVAIARQLQGYEEGFEEGGSDIDSEVLGLASRAMELLNGEIPENLKEMALRAIERQLTSEMLSEWSDEDRADRSQSLIEFRKELKAATSVAAIEVQAAEADEASDRKLPKLCYKKPEEAIRAMIELSEVARRAPGGGRWGVMPYGICQQTSELASAEDARILDRVFPEFFRRLWEVFYSDLAEAPSGLHDAALMERIIFVAGFLGLMLNMEPASVERLLRLATARKPSLL